MEVRIGLPRLDVEREKKNWRRGGGNMIVYVDFKSETSVLENLINRFSRPVDLMKREVMPRVLDGLSLPASTPFRWSQKAGCPCGCSPGFVLSRHDIGPELRDRNLWVEVDCQLVGNTPEERELVAARLAAVMGDPTLAPLIQKETDDELWAQSARLFS